MTVMVLWATFLFLSTNVDGLFVLVALFADGRLRTSEVVMGQCVGFSALITASLAASGLSLVLRPAVLGLLGLLGLAPVAIGLHKLLVGPRGGGQTAAGRTGDSPVPVAAVAAVVVANGGDNIAVYTPVFASEPSSSTASVCVTFAAMNVLWIVLARGIVRHPRLGRPLRRHGRRLAPYLLVAIGSTVLWRAGSFGLVAR